MSPAEPPPRTPVFVLLAGPNGAGKTTLFRQVIEPVTHLPFVNADLIASQRWPGDEMRRAYDAAQIAAATRAALIDARRSFAAETVFSHRSKIDLLRAALDAGFRCYLHVVLIPEDLAVERVRRRVASGGHDVPEDKIRARFGRLGPHVVEAIGLADESIVYDNSSARRPFRRVANYERGASTTAPNWPTWMPDALRHAGA